MSSWIRHERAFFETDMWLEEPFSKGQAWLDLIYKAYWKDSTLSVNSRKDQVFIPRGSMYFTYRYFAKRWQWDIGKVIRFIKFLARQCDIKTPWGVHSYPDSIIDRVYEDREIDLHSNSKGTILTIRNYNIYQSKYEDVKDEYQAHKKAKVKPDVAKYSEAKKDKVYQELWNSRRTPHVEFSEKDNETLIVQMSTLYKHLYKKPPSPKDLYKMYDKMIDKVLDSSFYRPVDFRTIIYKFNDIWKELSTEQQ